MYMEKNSIQWFWKYYYRFPIFHREPWTKYVFFKEKVHYLTKKERAIYHFWNQMDNFVWDFS